MSDAASNDDIYALAATKAGRRDGDMHDLLVERGLTGVVRTTRQQTTTYMERTLTGNPTYTFGLNDWRTATLDELVAATKGVAGDLVTDGDQAAGYISPRHTLDGIRRHAAVLRPLLRDGGASVLLATGHPMGLLEHYGELARALRFAGNRVLRPLDDHRLKAGTPDHDAGESGIRFIGGVACAFENEAILHTHLPHYMTAMITAARAAGDQIDLVVADHGMAGAAIEAGIATMSIADVNDSALVLAHSRGRNEHVLCIEDNFTPAEFAPVTEFMLTIASSHSTR
jgi:hypothetical protein